MRWLCITISSSQGVEGGEMYARSGAGTRPRYGACGLWTPEKQRDLSPCDPRLWSCVTVPPGPRRRWSGDRVVWDLPSSTYLVNKVKRGPPAPSLKGASTISPASASPYARLPSSQTHSFSDTCSGKLVLPEVLALHVWKYSQDSCVEKNCDVWSATQKNPMIYSWCRPCVLGKVVVGWIVSSKKTCQNPNP